MDVASYLCVRLKLLPCEMDWNELFDAQEEL